MLRLSAYTRSYEYEDDEMILKCVDNMLWHRISKLMLEENKFLIENDKDLVKRGFSRGEDVRYSRKIKGTGEDVSIYGDIKGLTMVVGHKPHYIKVNHLMGREDWLDYMDKGIQKYEEYKQKYNELEGSYESVFDELLDMMAFKLFS